MRSRRVAAVVCIAVGGAALALPALPRAQQNASGPPPVQAQTDLPLFRGGVELQLDVSVLDRNRRPVSDLTAADFTVRENGEGRPIRDFSLNPAAARASGRR